MKAIIFLIFPLIISFHTQSQCRVLTNHRDDGVTVKYLRPVEIGYSDKLMLSLSMQTNGVSYFVTTYTVFEYEALKLRGNLTLKFENNMSFSLEHYSSQLSTANGYPTTVSIFFAEKNVLANIFKSNISMAMVELENGVHQAVPVRMNADVLQKHYTCLSPRLEQQTFEPNLSSTFRVISERAYFYNEPKEGTRRNAYFIRNDQAVALRNENGFVYVVFINPSGRTSKGWVRMSDISFH
jgi:hypothetical protein